MRLSLQGITRRDKALTSREILMVYCKANMQQQCSQTLHTDVNLKNSRFIPESSKEVQFPNLSSSSSSNSFFSALSLASNLALYKNNTADPVNNSHSEDRN